MTMIQTIEPTTNFATDAARWQAVIERDRRADGVFY